MQWKSIASVNYSYLFAVRAHSPAEEASFSTSARGPSFHRIDRLRSPTYISSIAHGDSENYSFEDFIGIAYTHPTYFIKDATQQEFYH